MKTVCFTGHRHISPQEREPLETALSREILQQIQQGATCFRAGGAVGFDTMAALAVLKHRCDYPDIRLELILPCPSQPARWSAEDVRV
ncbi:MAG: DUF1273 domain-containing protein, partial [Ruminococcaceae bacterium]|nr:DUF1273 domain-containing protein [Oscillospiraceae bacterium]